MKENTCCDTCRATEIHEMGSILFPNPTFVVACIDKVCHCHSKKDPLYKCPTDTCAGHKENPHHMNQEPKCSGLHCRCMDIGGQCPNMHWYHCKVHNPDAYEKGGTRPQESEKEWCVDHGNHCKGHDVPKEGWEKEFEELARKLNLRDETISGFDERGAVKNFIRTAIQEAEERGRQQKENPIFSVGFHKGDMDFGLSSTIANLTYEQMRDFREMAVVGLGIAEQSWRERTLQPGEAAQQGKKI